LHDAEELLVDRFETNRSHLRSVAYRMLGSLSEADDAVQETWLRLNRSDSTAIENLSGWLTTVVSRICLDMLRSKQSRREETLETQEARPQNGDPEEEALMADSVGIAVLVLLATLTPAERLAFVLHEMFGVSFDEIGSILGRSSAAARQLASRARRSVRGNQQSPSFELKSQRSVIDAFLGALRAGDFEGLLTVLDPDVVVRAHIAPGAAPREIRGAVKWAKGAVAYGHMARFVGTAMVNGAVGLVNATGGRLSTALTFTIRNEKIVQVDVISDPELLKQITVTLNYES
jgi:RNA polymerase sigma factor (sigma-70 family)